MYIEEINGKYKFVESYTEHRTGKRRRVSVTLDKCTNASKREAQRILNQKIEEINFASAPQDLTLAQARRLYVEYQKATLKASTAKSCEHRTSRLCRILGEDTLLTSLNAGYINRAFIAYGSSKSTMNEDLTRLKAWVRWCYENDLVEDKDIRYLDKLRPYKIEKAPEKERYMEREELKKLLDSLTVPLNKLFIEFLALSGCRAGEAIALEWSDIDTHIHITKTYDTINKVTTSTKTQASSRNVYIQPELAKVIKEIREYYMRTGIRSELVFCRPDGSHITLRSMEKYFKEQCEKVLGRSLHLHTLRHTHASLLFEAGMSLDAVSERLGHADSRITKDIYLHITEKKKAEYDKRMERVSLLS